MALCSFCGKNIPRGTGKMYIKKDGKLFYFCSSKCEKNMIVLKRKPRTTRWTGLFHKLKKEFGKAPAKHEVEEERKEEMTNEQS